MIRLTDKELRCLQKIQLEMLAEVKRICNKNHIKYSLIGGTLLGAIRHKGYIPWDDDADVGMLRTDYEKFRIVCESELDEDKFYFQDDRNTEGYRWGYGKLRRKNTLFMRENQRHLNFGQEVFIDIFPLDFVPDNMLLREFHTFHCFCIRKILWAPVGAKAEKIFLRGGCIGHWNKFPKNVFIATIISILIVESQSNTVRLNLFPTRRPYGFPIVFFKELVEVMFEGENFPGSKYFDAYLTIKYGDYMKLPPEEERKVHPVSEIKLI